MILMGSHNRTATSDHLDSSEPISMWTMANEAYKHMPLAKCAKSAEL